jgi:hypothetical protein
VLANASGDNLAHTAVETKLRAIVPELPSPNVLRGGIMRLLPYRPVVQ